MSNVKAGDIAIIVRSDAGNEGKLVRVLRYIGRMRGWDGADRWEVDPLSGPLQARWMISRSPADLDGAPPSMRDAHMRPVTPPPGAITTESVNTLYAPSAPEKVENCNG